MIKVEICVDSPQGIEAAIAGGADRIELCACLDLGGLTPSIGLLRQAVASGIETRVLVRPRAGGFVYDRAELAVMVEDIRAARREGVGGLVIGAARPDRCLDREALLVLAQACGPLGRTLHRVFDLTPDPQDSLELAIELGFDRILTSGQQPNAPLGSAVLARLVEAAAGRITILAGGGIDADNAGLVLSRTRVAELHASCRAPATAGAAPPRGGRPPRRAPTRSARGSASGRRRVRPQPGGSRPWWRWPDPSRPVLSKPVPSKAVPSTPGARTSPGESDR